jgi:hypothetical protein
MAQLQAGATCGETYEIGRELLDLHGYEQHVYHHYDNDGAKINVKVEHNSRGNNWEATVTGASTITEACRLLFQAEQELQKQYGQPVTAA